MTADDRPLHQEAAAPGPAASPRFAEGILGKYFVAPALRRRPALVLRMLGRPVRSHASGVARQGAGRAGETVLGPPVGGVPDRAHPALPSKLPPSVLHGLVQRKPLVDAGKHGAEAAVVRRAAQLPAQPLHGGSSRVRHGEAVAGNSAGAARYDEAPHGPGLVQRVHTRAPLTAPSRAAVLPAAAIAGSTAAASGDIRAVPGGDSSAGLRPARVSARPGIHRLVQRRARAPEGTYLPTMGRVSRPAWGTTAAAAAARGVLPAATSGLGSTRPPAAGRMTPAPAVHAIQAGQTATLPPRESVHRRRAGSFVFGPAAPTASPPRTLTLQPRPLLPVPGIDRGTSLLERVAASSPGAMARPVAGALHAPALTSRVATATASRPVSAAGAAPRAAEAGPATGAQAAAGPTLVAATLGPGTAQPAASPAGSAPNGSAAAMVAALPIQALADRVFSLLERRLVVERERRGIRS
jgi:hypothetical protein